MENKLRELTQKANEQIQRIKDWYEEHSKAFDYMDLKLHDVSYYCYSKMEKEFPLCYENDRHDEYSYFYRFCESEYDSMVEDLKENFKINFKDFHHQLGRTSSFYLHDENIFQFERFRINWYWTMNQIVSEIYGSHYGCYTAFDKNGSVDLEKSLESCEEYMDDTSAYEYLNDEIEWIATEMYNDVLKKFEDMLFVYNYIKDFKENQVEIFKEWISYYENEFMEEKRKEEEYETKRQGLIAEFKNPVLRDVLNKYVHNNDAIENLLHIV